MLLEGRVALVTGGGSGMGRATARRLADEGMRVCVVDIDAGAAQAVAEPIGGLAVTADVSDPVQVDAAFSECIGRLGGVDLAYLNAGVVGAGPDIGALDDREYRRMMGVNVDGVVFGARAAVRAMRRRSGERSGGAIVATASIAGLEPFAPDYLYSVTKHAVVGLVRCIAPTLRGEGISVHAICPGITDTGMLGDEMRAMLRDAGVPLIPAEQIAEAVVRAATAPLEDTGTCWVCHPGQPPVPFAFRNVPGPHRILTRSRA